MIGRVLVVGTTLASGYLVQCLAKANTSTTFDYITIPEHSIDLENVTIIRMHLNYRFIGQTDRGNFNTPVEWVGTHIKNNQDKYDLVLILNYEFQRSLAFHDIKKSLKIPVLCPDFNVSRLEYEKLFAKHLLIDCGIPTPGYSIIDKNDVITIMDELPLPIVFKLDIHTSFMGYGAWVFKDRLYHTVLPTLLESQSSSQRYYIEDHINGREVSAHFLCNGSKWTYLGSARDYKRLKDGDNGHNTSGVGSYSPVEYFTESARNVVFRYVDTLLQYLTDIGMHYVGFLYLGVIMRDDDDIQILEINTRPGNPEFLTILDGLDHSVLLENLFNAASRQPFIDQEPSYHQASVAICVHNKNYNRFRKWNSVGPKISLTEDIDLVRSSMILGYFNYYGAIVARGSDRRAAAAKIYQRLDDSFIGDYTYRTDIGELE